MRTQYALLSNTYMRSGEVFLYLEENTVSLEKIKVFKKNQIRHHEFSVVVDVSNTYCGRMSKTHTIKNIPRDRDNILSKMARNIVYTFVCG